MMRTRQRKPIEEVYGNKFDTSKSQVSGQPGNIMPKTIRDCGYIITSNTPYSGTAVPPNSTGTVKNLNTYREKRKSARPSNKTATEKAIKQEKDSFVVDDVKHEHNIKMKGNRIEKPPPYYGGSTTGPNRFDNKTYASNYKDMPMEGNNQHHHHHHHHNHRLDDDKDDDTDEFFQLIRHTVESAIGKSISELLNRNFRELSSKVDRFSAELNNTNALLNQIQMDMNNKIVHYGEENSRHFRYLCMKSEYDKLFYQHQAMVVPTAAHPAATTNANGANTSAFNITTKTEAQKPDKRRSNPKVNTTNAKAQRNDAAKSNQNIRRNVKAAPSLELVKETRKKSSDDLSQKSSEVGMREVLEHIQKFCNQMQTNDANSNAPASSQRGFRGEDFLKIDKAIFNEDDDDDEVEDEDEIEFSSDGMTPRCGGNESHTYGGTTQRGGITSRASNGGGGDA